MSTSACGTSAMAPSSASKRVDDEASVEGSQGRGSPPAKSRRRNSSGPIHSVARVECAFARQASSENATPQTGRTAARAPAPPWKAKRVTGGRPVSHSREGTAGTRRCGSSTIDSRSGRIVEDRRGHVPDQLHGRALARLGGNLRAFFEHDSGSAGPQSDELFAVRRFHGGALQRALADEIRLEFADGPREARIVGRHRAVRVLTHDDVTLLRAQHMHGLSAVFHHTVLLSGGVY